MKPDKERYDNALAEFKSAYFNNDLEKEYLEFSKFIQGCFISKEGWIIDKGNYRSVNRNLMQDIKYKIEKHLVLWKLFFLVA